MMSQIATLDASTIAALAASYHIDEFGHRRRR
jgi:hypothetical protein